MAPGSIALRFDTIPAAPHATRCASLNITIFQLDSDTRRHWIVVKLRGCTIVLMKFVAQGADAHIQQFCGVSPVPFAMIQCRQNMLFLHFSQCEESIR